jgi:hypothetical protein
VLSADEATVVPKLSLDLPVGPATAVSSASTYFIINHFQQNIQRFTQHGQGYRQHCYHAFSHCHPSHFKPYKHYIITAGYLSDPTCEQVQANG